MFWDHRRINSRLFGKHSLKWLTYGCLRVKGGLAHGSAPSLPQGPCGDGAFLVELHYGNYIEMKR